MRSSRNNVRPNKRVELTSAPWSSRCALAAQARCWTDNGESERGTHGYQAERDLAQGESNACQGITRRAHRLAPGPCESLRLLRRARRNPEGTPTQGHPCTRHPQAHAGTTKPRITLSDMKANGCLGRLRIIRPTAPTLRPARSTLRLGEGIATSRVQQTQQACPTQPPPSTGGWVDKRAVVRP
jgi:hypothetical protein